MNDRVKRCSKCGSVGSIVELGKCCRIAELRIRASSPDSGFDPLPNYSQNFVRREIAARRRVRGSGTT